MRQSQIEALRSERQALPLEGEEEDQFGKVAARQNSKFEGDCGIKEIPMLFFLRFTQSLRLSPLRNPSPSGKGSGKGNTKRLLHAALFFFFLFCCLPLVANEANEVDQDSFQNDFVEELNKAHPHFKNTSNSPLRLLRVKAAATVYKPADQLQMQIGVVSQGANALKALQENNQKMSDVIKSLQSAGLSEQEYKTGRFSIQPIYAERPKAAPVNWHPYITGFEVNNTLAIQTEQLGKTGELIDQATQAGANSIDSIQFTLKDPQAFRKEAITQAAQIALEEAQALASATHIHLNSIFSLSIGEEDVAPRHGVYFAKAMGAPRTPIVSGDIEVSASVSIAFEIER